MRATASSRGQLGIYEQIYDASLVMCTSITNSYYNYGARTCISANLLLQFTLDFTSPSVL